MMKRKIKTLVEFEFEVKGKVEDIKQSISNQILTDLNAYWQNDDDTAQMTRIKIKDFGI